MKRSLALYLSRLDDRLDAISSREQRIRLIEDERGRVDRLEHVLADWAACTRGESEPPTRFSAFDLAILHGELSLRLEAAHDALALN
jgi:hypothetical protein